MTFSDPLDSASVKPDTFALKVWSLKRSANYGSKHFEEHPLEITGARLSADARTVTLDIPALTPAHCYELKADSRPPTARRSPAPCTGRFISFPKNRQPPPFQRAS